MSTNTQTPETPAEEKSSTPGTTPAAEETTTNETPHEGEKALGDAGKKALDAMKAERNEYKRLAAEAKTELERLKAEAEGRKAEYEAEQQARRVKEAALAAANERIALAELRAAAKGKLSDPADAATFIDVTQIEVAEDGAVDTTMVDALIDDLISRKPYLAAQSGQVKGSADGGARNGSTPRQLTHDEVRQLAAEGKHQEILDAKQRGLLNNLLT
ncbi:hypothetical protein [Canibacter oris]|uniref:Membrane protein involved in colicin uptake n=1 Tax=Canibacter oris TaxID=1365628 RepID=A0A840DK36_9MICO|nr:hypothetical protein [Canibacter oris]MBB4072053.1 membrane protein involved in colicin uptake [Canibacter oris]